MVLNEIGVSAVIADDEPLLRHHLNRSLAEAWPELDIVGIAENGVVALNMILERKPDIAFLDIRMPEMDGMALAHKLTKIDNPPLVVFITAYDEYAVQAFEANAVDYLLKPLTDARLDQCVAKIKSKVAAADTPTSNDLTNFLSQIQTMSAPSQPSYLNWIKASKGDDIHLVSVSDVLYFQSEDKYVTLYKREGSQVEEYLLRTTLRELLLQLDPEQFWQIHRSTVVNVSAIEKVKKDFTGKMNVLIDGKKLPVSRAMQSQFTRLY